MENNVILNIKNKVKAINDNYTNEINYANKLLEIVHKTYTSVNNLTANVVNQFNVSTTSTGTLKFISNSTNPYKIYLDGNIIFSSFPGGATDYEYFVPTGFHTIRVLQLSGYLLAPTDKTYTGTVTCGANLVTTFPN